MLRTGFVFDEPLRTPTYSTKFHTQAYRSGHNEAVLKTVCLTGTGVRIPQPAPKNTNFSVGVFLFFVLNLCAVTMGRRAKTINNYFCEAETAQSNEPAESSLAQTIGDDYATVEGKSWKFVGQAVANEPRSLENTDYFATAKIAKLPTSNVISNTFQNHNLIRRNIEAVTTRRSWKPFAQNARGFESLFLRHFNPWKT